MILKLIRTAKNVKYSDGTVLFGNTSSPGSRLTIRLCKQYGKPCLTNPTIEQLRRWLEEYQIRILNVAGNRVSKNPGVVQQVRTTLLGALTRPENKNAEDEESA